MSSPKVFVIGVGRSGTSLLQSMLASHSTLAFPPETSFFRRYVSKKVLEKTWKKEGVEGVQKVIDSDSQLQRLSVDLKTITRDFGNFKAGTRDAQCYQAILKAECERQGKIFAGDKDPRSIEYIPLLHHYWPDLHVIHIIRDPRDVLASKKKAAWSRDKNSLYHILANRVQMKIGCKDGVSYFGRNYHEITYSGLISSPEETLRRLCDSLELPFEPAMLNYRDTAEGLVSHEEMSWKKETMQPVNTSNTGKWKKELTSFEAAVTEVTCREGMNKSGEVASGAVSKLPVITWFFAYGAGFLVNLAAFIYQLKR